MILPIVAYGNPVLKKGAKNITQDYPERAWYYKKQSVLIAGAYHEGRSCYA